MATYTVAASGASYSTIAQVNAATFSTGDIIAFNKGETFSDALLQLKSGTDGSHIVYTSYGTGARPILSKGIRVVTGGHITIQGLHSTPTTTPGSYNALSVKGSHDIFVDDCYFDGLFLLASNPTALVTGSDDGTVWSFNITISGCTFTQGGGINSGGGGLVFTHSVHDADITGCTFTDNHEVAFQTGPTSTYYDNLNYNILFYGNTVTGTSKSNGTKQANLNNSKAITAFADNGDGKTQVTGASHGFYNGNLVKIVGSDTSAYNSNFIIEQVAANTFVIDVGYVDNPATKGTAWVLCDSGVNIALCDRARVERNLCEGNLYFPIALDTDASNCLVVNNLIKDCAGTAAIGLISTGDTAVGHYSGFNYNNTIAYNTIISDKAANPRASYGIWIRMQGDDTNTGPHTGNKIYNNIIYTIYQWFNYVYFRNLTTSKWGTDFVIDRNIYYNPSFGNIQFVVDPEGDGNVTVASLASWASTASAAGYKAFDVASFNSNWGVNFSTLVPSAGSPAIQTAWRVPGITIDYAGTLRGFKPDIGAYQGSAAVAPPAGSGVSSKMGLGI